MSRRLRPRERAHRVGAVARDDLVSVGGVRGLARRSGRHARPAPPAGAPHATRRGGDASAGPTCTHSSRIHRARRPSAPPRRRRRPAARVPAAAPPVLAREPRAPVGARPAREAAARLRQDALVEARSVGRAARARGGRRSVDDRPSSLPRGRGKSGGPPPPRGCARECAPISLPSVPRTVPKRHGVRRVAPILRPRAAPDAAVVAAAFGAAGGRPGGAGPRRGHRARWRALECALERERAAASARALAPSTCAPAARAAPSAPLPRAADQRRPPPVRPRVRVRPCVTRLASDESAACPMCRAPVASRRAHLPPRRRPRRRPRRGVAHKRCRPARRRGRDRRGGAEGEGPPRELRLGGVGAGAVCRARCQRTGIRWSFFLERRSQLTPSRHAPQERALLPPPTEPHHIASAGARLLPRGRRRVLRRAGQARAPRGECAADAEPRRGSQGRAGPHRRAPVRAATRRHAQHDGTGRPCSGRQTNARSVPTP